MRKVNWDEPYKSKTIKGEDILVGAAKDGSLIYLPALPKDPSRNILAFYGSNEQNKTYLTTSIFNSILGKRSAVIVSPDIRGEIFGFARAYDYVVKELNFESNSNHLNLLGLMGDEDPVGETDKFISRIVSSNKMTPSIHQNNALNYLSSVVLFVRYTKGGDIKDIGNYIKDYDSFEKEIHKCHTKDPARQFFEFSRQANNYFKWDIPCISNVLRPFFSRSVLKTLDSSGSMSPDEINREKCIYIINPKSTYKWLPSFILSYFLASEGDFDIYIDGIDTHIPYLKEALHKKDKKIIVTLNNIDDIVSHHEEGLLPLFGTKLSFHGCDMHAAEYLSRLSGGRIGGNTFDAIWNPQEIVSCGQKTVSLFVLSAKRYSYKVVDLSYLNDVISASVKGAGKDK